MSARFEVTAEPIGGQIVVNGADVTSLVRRAVIELSAEQPTRLGLELKSGAEGTVVGEGVVEVVRPGESVADWLAAVDAAALRARVLEVMATEGMAGDDPVILALAVLRSWADGAADRA